MRELELRCCCDPGRLLGWLQLPDARCRAGELLVYPVLEMPPPAAQWRPDEPELAPTITIRQVALTVEHLSLGGGWRLAVKSNNYPLETLRRLPGFREARARVAEGRRDGTREAVADQQTRGKETRRDGAVVARPGQPCVQVSNPASRTNQDGEA